MTPEEYSAKVQATVLAEVHERLTRDAERQDRMAMEEEAYVLLRRRHPEKGFEELRQLAVEQVHIAKQIDSDPQLLAALKGSLEMVHLRRQNDYFKQTIFGLCMAIEHAVEVVEAVKEIVVQGKDYSTADRLATRLTEMVKIARAATQESA